MPVTIKWGNTPPDLGVRGDSKKSTFFLKVGKTAVLSVFRVTLTRNTKLVYEVDHLYLYTRGLFDPPLTEIQREANRAAVLRAVERAKKFAGALLAKKVKPMIFDPKEIPMTETIKKSQELLRKHQEAAEANRPKPKAPDASSKADDVYTGPPPKERGTTGLKRLLAPTSVDPVPSHPADAKFSTLLAWGESVRDHYFAQKKFPTANYLFYAAGEAFGSTSERGLKAAKRIAQIYSAEFLASRRQTTAMIKKAETPEDGPKQPKEKEETPKVVKPEPPEKDEWGYRKNTEAHKINAALTTEPRTPAEIKKAAGVGRDVVSHLRTLVEKKLAKKVGDKYRLRKGVEAVS